MKFTKFFIILLIVFTFIAGDIFASLSEEEIYPIFSKANEAFRKANSGEVDGEEKQKLLDTVINGYKKIIKQGEIENAKLYYNLANAYLLKGKLGKAILNYRRAENLDRSDGQIQKNLSYARSKRVDIIQTDTEKKILKTLFFWHYDISAKHKSLIALISLAIFLLIASFLLWGIKFLGMKTLLALSSLVFVLFIGSVLIDYYMSKTTEHGVILAEYVTARQGNGREFSASFDKPLHEGTEFKLVEKRKNWLKIELANGDTGWIPRKTAEII